MPSQPTTELSPSGNNISILFWCSELHHTCSCSQSLPQLTPSFSLSQATLNFKPWVVLRLDTWSKRGKSYRVFAQYWAQHRLLSLLCSQSYIYLDFRDQSSACCYQISYRKVKVMLRAAKGVKLPQEQAEVTPPLSPPLKYSPTLCFASQPTHFLCPISLCPGFTSSRSFPHAVWHTQAASEGGDAVSHWLPGVLASCNRLARYLWNWGLKAVACSLKHVVAVRCLCIFFLIPTDLKTAKSSKIKTMFSLGLLALMKGASLWGTRRTQETFPPASSLCEVCLE